MRDWIGRRLGAWLVDPWLPLHLALLAALLALPALWIGWQFDDHFHRLTMLGAPEVERQPVLQDSRRRVELQHLIGEPGRDVHTAIPGSPRASAQDD